MHFHYLSYPLSKSMPVYGGANGLELTPLKTIDKGDSCNTWRICFENHWGSHIDGPNHFFGDGLKIMDYPADFWMFDNPQVLEVSLERGELLRWDAIKSKINRDADLLLLKSGWGQNRDSNLYWKENPGIHADVAIGLRNMNCAIRVVGLDWISVSSYVHRQEGRKSHLAFLDSAGEGEPVLLVEDMDLSGNMMNLSKVMIAPMIVEDVDSSPCTIIGVIED